MKATAAIKMSKRAYLPVLLFLLLVPAGCAHYYGQSVWEQQAVDVPFTDLLANPDAYKGQIVSIAGSIVTTTNEPGTTTIEVLQSPRDYYGRPTGKDYSQGRFLGLDSVYRDPAVYSPGRSVTIIGEVEGKRTQNIDKIEYTYPVIRIKEIKLWEEKPRYYYYPYPGPYYRSYPGYYWRYPYYWYSPYPW